MQIFFLNKSDLELIHFEDFTTLLNDNYTKAGNRESSWKAILGLEVRKEHYSEFYKVTQVMINTSHNPTWRFKKGGCISKINPSSANV